MTTRAPGGYLAAGRADQDAAAPVGAPGAPDTRPGLAGASDSAGRRAANRGCPFASARLLQCRNRRGGTAASRRGVRPPSRAALDDHPQSGRDTAVTVPAAVRDFRRFTNADKLVSYPGMNPRVRATAPATSALRSRSSGRTAGRPSVGYFD
ncbi:transposase [Streptomyces sp. NPDC001076]